MLVALADAEAQHGTMSTPKRAQPVARRSTSSTSGSAGWGCVAQCTFGLLLGACGNSGPSPANLDEHAAAPSSASVDVALVPKASPIESAAASPSRAPQPQADSWPPGVAPLSEAERLRLEEKCILTKKSLLALARMQKRDEGVSQPAQLLELMETHKQDVSAECFALLRRQFVADEARSREALAVNSLRMMGVGLADAYARNGKLCADAPPVPRILASLKAAAHLAERSEYEHPAWKCSNFTTIGAPQFWQYSIKVVEPGKRVVAIARGFPVKGDDTLVELFLGLEVGAKGLPIDSMVVMRGTPPS